MTAAVAGIIFMLGYIAITLEHKLKINKSAMALLTGGLLWLLAAIATTQNVQEEMIEVGGDIFGIVIFLIAAMSIVEVLVHYRFFDIVQARITGLGLNTKQQFLVIAIVAFGLSAVIDNLTTTIVMIRIAQNFFKGKNFLKICAAIVIAANAGGAFSPIGDVTTIMLWLSDKFSVFEIVSMGILPAMTLAGVAIFWIAAGMEPEKNEATKENVKVKSLSKSEKTVVVMSFASFILPLFMGLIGVPPYIGLLLGLGAIWIAIDIFKQQQSVQESHMSASIERFIQKTDLASIKFFVGILLAVSALNAFGILDTLSHALFGDAPTAARIISGNIGLGFISAILDNVPLTAIAIELLHTTQTSLWVLLALAVGNGGSLLVIGSAAGVVAMGMNKELTFANYMRVATVPALVGFVACILVWLAQYSLIG